MQKTYAKLPVKGFAQLRVYNSFNCSILTEIGDQEFELLPLSMWQNISIAAEGSIDLKYHFNFEKCLDRIRVGNNGKVEKCVKIICPIQVIFARFWPCLYTSSEKSRKKIVIKYCCRPQQIFYKFFTLEIFFRRFLKYATFIWQTSLVILLLLWTSKNRHTNLIHL